MYLALVLVWIVCMSLPITYRRPADPSPGTCVGRPEHLALGRCVRLRPLAPGHAFAYAALRGVAWVGSRGAAVGAALVLVSAGVLKALGRGGGWRDPSGVAWLAASLFFVHVLLPPLVSQLGYDGLLSAQLEEDDAGGRFPDGAASAFRLFRFRALRSTLFDVRASGVGASVPGAFRDKLRVQLQLATINAATALALAALYAAVLGPALGCRTLIRSLKHALPRRTESRIDSEPRGRVHERFRKRVLRPDAPKPWRAMDFTADEAIYRWAREKNRPRGKRVRRSVVEESGDRKALYTRRCQ